MAASTPAMSTRPVPGHRRSSSATNVSISALSASIASAASSGSARARATTANKTPASTKPKAVVKRRNSLSAGAIVNKDARVLAGVFAMVDVRVGQDAQIDCSSVVAEKMAELGAVIVKRFTPRVTHIVLSHLTDAWKDKIAKWQSNISVGLARRVDGRPEMQIVSQLWVNACYVSKTRMDEKPFFPVSKANSNGVEGHLHLNGAMKQFVAANPTPAGTTVPTVFRTTSAENTPAPQVSEMTRPAFSTTSSSSASTNSSSTSGATSRTATANNSITSARPNAVLATANRRKTLDAKGVSAIANARKPAGASTMTTGVAPPTSRSAAIQFQFGAAAALAAATLGSHAVKRKRRALSMEPMASDAIQKLLSASGNELVTPRKEAVAESTTVTPATATAGAKKKLDLDTILTPVSIEKSSKRRALSSAKRRKTMSEVPSATLTMPVHHVEAAPLPADPNPQKKLFQDTPTSDCVAESQSEPEGDEEECKRPAVTAAAAESLTNGDVVGDLVSASASTDGATPGAVVDGSGAENANAASSAAAMSSDTLGSGSINAVASVPASEALAATATCATATAASTEAPSTEARSANTFSIGVSGRPVRLTRARAGSAAAASKAVGPAPAAKAPIAATGVWRCNACGGSNTRARRLCKDCRAPKTTAQVVLPVKEIAAASTRTTIRKPVTAPEPKTPSAPARVVKEPVITSPKVTTATGISTRRILTTPKTITKPAAAASKRQRAPPSGVAAPKTTSAARKLPLVPPRTPAKPSSQSAPASSQPPKTPAARSISVLEMTPVRVTEGSAGGSKRSLSTNSTPNSAASKKVRLGGSSTSNHRTSGHDTSFEEKVAVDQLERIVTPQRVSSSTRRSTASFGNTPVKTPVDKKNLVVLPPPRRVRSVIGITGVDLETRGVIECAVHAIDASMVTELGHRKARVVKSVDYSAAVTHLIVGEDTKRTIKVLFAIARGAWIVSEAWVFSSLEQEQWLPEEDYELAIHANKFARQNPEARQIFRGMKFFVGSNVEPSREVLQSLLQCAGGEVCNQISVADMCICGDGSLFRRAQRTGVRVVTAKWVFDSIGAMQLEDDDKYGLSTASFDADE